MSNVLETQVRDQLGSRPARKLRTHGRIPAIVHFDGQQPSVNISLDEHDFLVARRQHEHVYELDLAGKTEMALIQELQWDTFGDRIQHIDFKRVLRGQKTEAEVEIEFFGLPQHGMLHHLLTHVTIRSVPAKIPDSLTAQIEGLEPGASITAGDLQVPEGVELVTDPGVQIASILMPRGTLDEEEAAEAPAEGEAASGEETPSGSEEGGAG